MQGLRWPRPTRERLERPRMMDCCSAKAFLLWPCGLFFYSVAYFSQSWRYSCTQQNSTCTFSSCLKFRRLPSLWHDSKLQGVMSWGVPSYCWPWLGWLWPWQFCYLPDLAWAVGIFAEMAGQLGKRVEHRKSKANKPQSGTPCKRWSASRESPSTLRVRA